MTPTRTLAFLLLCLWASAGWIAAQAIPSQLTAPAAQGFHLILIGAAATLFARKAPRPALLPITLGGLALLAAPLLLLDSARSLVTSSLAVVVFSLLPVVIAVATGAMRWLAPALLGTTGVLVLLPISLPQTGRGILGIALMTAAMLLTAAAILWLHTRKSGPWSIASICLANGALLTLIGHADPNWTWMTAAYEFLRCLLLTAPETLLLLCLIPLLEPRRLAARWLIAPLFTVLEGFILVRPPVDTRLLLGILLLATGGAWLFCAESPPDPSNGVLGLIS
jgi:drug/metabolite transporter (DMT)-like permease